MRDEEHNQGNVQPTIQEKPAAPSPFIKVQKKDVNQKLVLCAEDSLRRLVEI